MGLFSLFFFLFFANVGLFDLCFILFSLAVNVVILFYFFSSRFEG